MLFWNLEPILRLFGVVGLGVFPRFVGCVGAGLMLDLHPVPSSSLLTAVGGERTQDDDVTQVLTVRGAGGEVVTRLSWVLNQRGGSGGGSTLTTPVTP